MLNLANTIGYAEARSAYHAMGLGTELGLMHTRRPHYPHPMVLDLVEAARPHVGQMILNLIAERTFSRRGFMETPEGQFLVGSPLDR